MMKHLPILLILLMLTSPAFALDIFYPADGTYVVHSDFLIVKAGENVDALTLEIGGEKSDLLDISSADYKAAFGDFLIVQPNWDAGENTVLVEAYKGGQKVAGKKADFFFQENQQSPLPQGFIPFVMHTPAQEALCVDCHNMSPTLAQLEKIGEENPCASCHKRMLERKNVHGPAGAWQCVYCHDPQKMPVRYVVRKSRISLCQECHEAMVDKFSTDKFTHGPVAVGMCDICHDSHASDYRAQLRGETNAVCLNCHEGIDTSGHVGRGVSGRFHPLSGVKIPGTGVELSCVGCHDPHGGAGPLYFQKGKTSRMSLCVICHQK